MMSVVMIDAVVQTLPLIIILFLAYGLKRFKICSADDGNTLLKISFYFGVPPLIFHAITTADLTTPMLGAMFFPFVLIAITLLAVWLLRRTFLKKVPRKTFGVMAVGVAIMNTGFLIPFISKLYGSDGLAQLMILDCASGILTFSVIYAIAVGHGKDKPSLSYIAKKILVSPVTWAAIIAFIVKANNIPPPTLVSDIVEILSVMVSPIILIALGLKLTFRINKPMLLAISIGLRMVLGFIIGLLFVKILGITGTTAYVILLSAMAPIGFNSMLFSNMEKLDDDFASSQVSLALILAIILMPFAVWILPYLA
jgi:predicted permease